MRYLGPQKGEICFPSERPGKRPTPLDQQPSTAQTTLWIKYTNTNIDKNTDAKTKTNTNITTTENTNLHVN